MFAQYLQADQLKIKINAPYQSALYKSVPIDLLEEFRLLARQMGLRFTIRYRGPRPNSRYNTHKRDANRFDAYLKA